MKWDPSAKPFRYDRAPSLFKAPAPGGQNLFPRLYAFLAHTNRTTIDAKFASRFRARQTHLDPEIAQELEAGFKAAIMVAKPSDFITRYNDALPWCGCPTPANERRNDYRELLKDLKQTGCALRRRTNR